ncbi:MAG TPA: MG2 domain-containing protein, partial [Blastocatellia bacterium]|nr:MG2 domain-containing protein [Blastocatellia bacterium]
KDQEWNNQPIISWIQVTGMGLDASVDATDMVAWATSLRDGSALPGVELTLPGQGKAVTTGSNGIARLQLPESEGSGVLLARKGDDTAILPESTYWYRSNSWIKRPVNDLLRWYVFDDRGIYRPGEEVHIKGWVRLVGGGKDGDVGPLNDSASGLTFTLKDSRGNEVQKGSLALNALGGFDTVLKLPDNINLGSASLFLNATGTPGTVLGAQDVHGFQVQEFRRPEFEVSASASDGMHFIGDHGEFAVKASYYAGGGLANAPVNWRVTSTPGYFTPPGRGDFTFGEWVPWWGFAGRPDTSIQVQTFEGKTDFAGTHHLRIDFDSANPPRPYNVTAEASVTDVNRQAWSASASMLVHPADLYVGLRSPRTFVQPREPLIVESIVTDLDGKAVSGKRVKMRTVLLDWKYKHGEWKQVETSPQECEVSSGPDPVRCTFQPKEGGTYKVTATVMDEKERRNQSSLTLWVAGGKQPPLRDVEQETATLIPDKKDYKSGDTAEILVQSPFYPADGLVTLERSGIVSTEHFHMDGPSHTLKVPLKEVYIPNIRVEVELAGSAARAAEPSDQGAKPGGKPQPKRPAYAAGSLNIPISAADRKLIVSATPRDKALEPGGETSVDLEVKDGSGKPVQGSEVALVVVDEAILSLTSYKLADPLAAFYLERAGDTNDYHSRGNILLASERDLASVKEKGAPPAPIPMAGVGGLATVTPAPMAARQIMGLSYNIGGGSGRGPGGAQPI